MTRYSNDTIDGAVSCVEEELTSHHLLDNNLKLTDGNYGIVRRRGEDKNEGTCKCQTNVERTDPASVFANGIL